MAELGLTANHSAASRRDAPDSMASTTRSRNSKEHGFGIDPPSKNRISAARFPHSNIPGNTDSTQVKSVLMSLPSQMETAVLRPRLNGPSGFEDWNSSGNEQCRRAWISLAKNSSAIQLRALKD
jgi:hypothetical protein